LLVEGGFVFLGLLQQSNVLSYDFDAVKQFEVPLVQCFVRLAQLILRGLQLLEVDRKCCLPIAEVHQLAVEFGVDFVVFIQRGDN
jgi:hypothetical protein